MREEKNMSRTVNTNTVPLCGWLCDIAFNVTVTPMHEENKQAEE